MKVNVLEAKNRLSELIRAAQAGEPVIIANRGKPVARLIAETDESATMVKGSADSILGWIDGNPVPLRSRRSSAEMEKDIADMRDGWE